MKDNLCDIDQQPGNPAVPFLLGTEELGHQNQHGHAGIQIRVRVCREQLIQQPAPRARNHKHRHNCKHPLHGSKF